MQSVKRLDSVWQFCEVLLYGDGNGGADFTDLPDCLEQTEYMMRNRNKGLFPTLRTVCFTWQRIRQ